MNCFVGRHRCRVNAAGVLRLPKDWLPGIGDTVYLLREKSSGRILLLPRREFSKCAIAMQNNCVALNIDKAGSLALEDNLPETAQYKGAVILRGCLRYIELCPERHGVPLCLNDKAEAARLRAEQRKLTEEI